MEAMTVLQGHVAVEICRSLRQCLAAQVSAWEARGKLPLGADMTAVIQRIRLRDPGHTSSEQQACGFLSAEQESLLRMQHALAIIRLVNGISDSAQKGTVAKSVANLAETAGASAQATSGSSPGCHLVALLYCQGR